MNAYLFFDSLKSIKDISEDIKQYNENINALNNACLKRKLQVNEDEIKKCLKDTDNKYGIYVRMLNCLKFGLNFQNSRVTISQLSLQEKINNLLNLTNDIPAYICLRENLNSSLKELIKQNNNKIISDNDIDAVKRNIT